MKKFVYGYISIIILMAIPFMCCAEVVKLQRAVPYGILSRVFQIRYGNVSGSSFVIDVDSKQYIITARHILPKAKDGDSAELYISGNWHPLIIKLIYPKDDKIDIVALAADHLIAPKMPINIGKRYICWAGCLFSWISLLVLLSKDDPTTLLVPFIKGNPICN
jgi:hypothetical protein